jgi:hypothetical protein
MAVETNLETILKRWKFPNDIIAKYKSLGIINIFEWQSECLHIEDVLGLNFFSFDISKNGFSFNQLHTLRWWKFSLCSSNISW